MFVYIPRNTQEQTCQPVELGGSRGKRLKMICSRGGQHNATVMEDDSFLFLIAMVAVPMGPKGTGRRQTAIVSNEY